MDSHLLLDSASAEETGDGFGGDVPTTNLDLVLSALVALALPKLCEWVTWATNGALAGILLYYVPVCIVLVLWRKGTLDYRGPIASSRGWEWLLMGLGFALVSLMAALSWGASYGTEQASPGGLAITALVWAPLNGALEQLSWLYVLDAWRNRWRGADSVWLRAFGLVVGIVLLLVLVATIHTSFWLLFLPEKLDQTREESVVNILINFPLTAVYVLLYYTTRSMWPTFFVHTLVDLKLVLLANYSILPSLFCVTSCT